MEDLSLEKCHKTMLLICHSLSFLAVDSPNIRLYSTTHSLRSKLDIVAEHYITEHASVRGPRARIPTALTTKPLSHTNGEPQHRACIISLLSALRTRVRVRTWPAPAVDQLQIRCTSSPGVTMSHQIRVTNLFKKGFSMTFPWPKKWKHDLCEQHIFPNIETHDLWMHIRISSDTSSCLY